MEIVGMVLWYMAIGMIAILMLLLLITVIYLVGSLIIDGMPKKQVYYIEYQLCAKYNIYIEARSPGQAYEKLRKKLRGEGHYNFTILNIEVL